MMRRFILDRYLLSEWLRILIATALGFPIIVTAIELTDNLGRHLSRGIEPGAIALGYVYGMPDKVFLILPAAVLFATVFSLGRMSRHSELTATKASGRSLRRTIVPVMAAAVVTTAAAAALGEWAPTATSHQLELLGEKKVRSQTSRFRFVYRADQGWVYAIHTLDVRQRVMRNIVLEREGSGPAYPTLVVQSPTVAFNESAGRWAMRAARFRVLPDLDTEQHFLFDSLFQRSLVERPAELLNEPKEPKEMRYAELGRYIDDLERSGGDGRKLRVRQALKIAIPFTCLVIALFAAPLALTTPRGSGAVGIGISLITTIIFLMFIQLSEAVGASGIVSPAVAAWAPNALFLAAGLLLLRRAPT
ncbi:MAG TPA: LptF/LptG family permease [Gemmatimonadales bacterium]